MSDEINTDHDKPSPRRPKYGWSAWESTVGYIHSHHSADATLRLRIYPSEHYIGWAASLSWGTRKEQVEDKVAFSAALNDLWKIVAHHHQLLDESDAISRQPLDYTDDNMLDPVTYKVFSSLVNTTDTVFKGDWQILISYRPIEQADKRVQTRLTADNLKVNRGGNGATLREACRNLLRNAAPTFHQYRSKKSE